MARSDLRNVDLNAHGPLHALLTERSVTLAAERLSVSQATVRVSLRKLRRLLDDPLLVRRGRQMTLTPLAEVLLPQVEEVLVLVRRLLSSAAVFDPATSRRSFIIAAGDYPLLVLIRPLLHQWDTVAPSIRINVVPMSVGQQGLLYSARCDLLLWPPAVALAEMVAFPSAVLLSDEFVGVVSADHPEVGEYLTEEQLATLPSIRVDGPTPLPLNDRLCNVVTTTETFTGAAHMVPGTRLFVLVPRGVFDSFGAGIGLRAVPLEGPAVPAIESMYWHPLLTEDPSHRWLRTSLLRLAADQDQTKDSNHQRDDPRLHTPVGSNQLERWSP
ncbi:LysR family transcriptional regulator [Kribbella antibiotica]|uniref:LysR family transcriptional regulator n=1 Tax=Kribbella antibiotica TaxID=190195 RepID=A0A4R4ZLW0_9ACTN|nr:LysR family transcriptional regulator [Kribbella antibiotica]TDD58874.1 LysR family transcriptional regulator [Kribbella antibiotica]